MSVKSEHEGAMPRAEGIADVQCPVLTSTGACTKRNQAVSGIRKLQEKIDQLQTEQT